VVPVRPQLPWEHLGGPGPLSGASGGAGSDQPAAGALHFDGTSLLVGGRTDPWVAAASASGRFSLRLDFRTEHTDQSGPARLLAVTEDTSNANLMVGQDGADLVVRMRRSGSDTGGDPAFRVPDAFRPATPGAWRTLELDVGDGLLVARLDGTEVLHEQASADGWDPSYRIALGDEPNGERGWVGDLREVRVFSPDVSSPDVSSDLLAPGTLNAGSKVVWRSRVRSLGALTNHDSLLVVAARFVAFVPLGFAVALLMARGSAGRLDSRLARRPMLGSAGRLDSDAGASADARVGCPGRRRAGARAGRREAVRRRAPSAGDRRRGQCPRWPRGRLVGEPLGGAPATAPALAER